MISNSDVTASQKLGIPSNRVSPSDYINNLKDKALNWKPSKTTWLFMIGAVVVMIVERKLNLKPKKFNLNYGGKK